MPEYTHTLIPDGPHFIPDPKQVGSFLASLLEIGAAPSKPEIFIAKFTGEFRFPVNVFTGETLEPRPIRRSERLDSLALVPTALIGLNDYNLTIGGDGPPELEPYKISFVGKYNFLIRCCVRANIVSTSDWRDKVPIDRKVECFGCPCSAEDRLGIFHNPETLQVIEVPKAGCARFWIELECGKCLLPAIKNTLEVINPAIIHTAEQDFGINFVQGCYWCA